MFNTPILFLVFNRLDTTERVFEKIRELKPKQLFIAADGPRTDSEKRFLKIVNLATNNLHTISYPYIINKDKSLAHMIIHLKIRLSPLLSIN